MIIKNHRNATPFIGNAFVLDRPNFLNHGKQSFLRSPSYSNVIGHNHHLEFDSVLKSSIGEWIERNSLYRFDKKGTMSTAFSLLDGSEIQVESEKIYFADIEHFNDSCGVASHLNSNQAIYNAFMEFYERLCLVFTWLSKRKGKLLKIDEINFPNIRNISSKLHNYIDELYVLDISLHPSIHTVIGVGIGEHFKAIGASSSFNLDNAIKGSLEEMLQVFGNSWTKHHINKFEEYTLDENAVDLYAQYYDSLSPIDFKNEWSFLWTDTTDFNYICESENLRISFTEKITEVCNDLGISPYCTLIPCFFNGFETKIVKVFAPDSYPHMYPGLFTEEQTTLDFNKNVSSFPNSYRQIPFP